MSEPVPENAPGSSPVLRPLTRRLSRALDRLRPSEQNLLLITAIAVGALTGLAAMLFVELIPEAEREALEVLFPPGRGAS